VAEDFPINFSLLQFELGQLDLASSVVMTPFVVTSTDASSVVVVAVSVAVAIAVADPTDAAPTAADDDVVECDT